MLRELNLLPVYDSSEYNLVKELIIPLLSNCKLYYRGVGFFTSGWLRLASEGLSDLVENGGKGKIVMSPIMEESDWNALKVGVKAKQNEILKEILRRNIGDIKLSLTTDTLNILSWMIADGFLDFKFAVTRDWHSRGDYHDKVGVFVDSVGDIVAIHGSFNDTYKGSLNGEAFSVFKSWDEGQLPFVVKHQERLIKLWNDSNNQFTVIPLPVAIKEDIVKLRSSQNRPYSRNPYKTNDKVRPINKKIELYAFQNKAIEKWMEAQCRGVFEMATGTGKTLTSLAAASILRQKKGKLALIILVPYLHLVEQWENNCRDFRFKPIPCSGSHHDWGKRLRSKIQDFNIGALQSLCVVAVHATASTERFRKIVLKLDPANTMVIGDEVHALGARDLRKAMITNTSMRLGLSATPHRWFDDDGTKCIFDYFGDVCFSFSIEEAIGKYLTPYEYHPVLVHFTSGESLSYNELTSKIGVQARLVAEGKTDRKYLDNLLIQRSRLVARANEKIRKMLAILENLQHSSQESEVSHTLVYCAPGTHKDVLLKTSKLGIRCHEFVHNVGLRDRQVVLTDFDRGDIQVLVAIKCLDEGVDVPSTKTAFLLASTTNPREFVQRRGRILRLSEGKKLALIYDFFVVPPDDSPKENRELDLILLRTQLPRFAEFVSSAQNEFDAREKFFNILDKYGILHLMDLKPWDLQKKSFDSTTLKGD